MAKTNVVKEDVFDYGRKTIGQNQVIDFEFELLPEYNIAEITHGWHDQNCSCFSWHFSEAERKIKGKWTVDKMPKPASLGNTKKTATISFETIHSPKQYREMVNNGKRSLMRQVNPAYQNSLIKLTVDGYVERLN